MTKQRPAANRSERATAARVALLVATVMAGVVMIALMLRAGHVLADQRVALLHRVDEPVSLHIESESGHIAGARLTDMQRRTPEWSLHPVRDMETVCVGRPGVVRLLGLDFIGDRRLDLPAAFLGDGTLEAWRGPTVLLSPSLRASWQVRPGDLVEFHATGDTLRARVATAALPEAFHAGTNGRLAAVDIRWFEHAFVRAGTETSVEAIAVARDAATPLMDVETGLEERLPPGLFLVRRGERTDAAKAWVQAWGAVATLIGQVGVFAGAGVVFLGAYLGYLRRERRRVVRSWREFASSAAEVSVGVGIGTLLALWVEPVAASVWMSWWRPEVGVGIGSSNLGSIAVPSLTVVALAFAMATLAGALRFLVAASDSRPRSGIRFAIVGVLLVLSSILSLPPAMSGALPQAFASAFAFIVAVTLFSGPLFGATIRAFRLCVNRRRPLVARVVAIHVSDAWPTMSVALTLVVFAFGVFGVGWTIVDAMNAREQAWLDGEASPDVVLIGSPDPSGAGRHLLAADWLTPIRQHPDVVDVRASRRVPATIRSATFPIALVTSDILRDRGGERTLGSGNGDGVVSLALTRTGARDFGLREGDHTALTTASGVWPAVVSVVVFDRVGDDVLAFASLDAYGDRLSTEGTLTDIGIRFRSGVDPDVARREIVAGLPGLRPSVVGTDQIRRGVDATLVETTRGLRSLLMLLGLVGVLLAVTLGPAIVCDVPDAFAVLSALGVPRADLARGAAVATLLVSGVALVLGVLTSFVVSGVCLVATGSPDGLALRTVPWSGAPFAAALAVWLAGGVLGAAWARLRLAVPVLLPRSVSS